MFQVSNCKLQNVGTAKVLSDELLVQMKLAITDKLPEKGALESFVKEEVCRNTELGVVFCEMLLKVLAENWDSNKEAKELGRIVFDVIFAEIDVWLGQSEATGSHLTNSKKVVLLFCFLCVNLDSIGRAIFELVGGSGLGEGKVRLEGARIGAQDLEFNRPHPAFSQPLLQIDSSAQTVVSDDAATQTVRRVKVLHGLLNTISNIKPAMSSTSPPALPASTTPASKIMLSKSKNDAKAATPSHSPSSEQAKPISPREDVLSKCHALDSSKNICTYVKGGDEFSVQHWYNCYTCGLHWDKGCCGLCARVCHKGHDVVYSRQSSFFCDCGHGGDVASSNFSGIKCMCLSSLSQSKMKLAYLQKKLSPVAAKRKPSLQLARASSDTAAPEMDENIDKYLVLSNEAKSKLVKQSVDQNWVDKIFQLFLAFYRQAIFDPSFKVSANPDDMEVDEKDQGTPMSQPGRLRGCSVGSVDDFKLDDILNPSSAEPLLRRSKPLELSVLHKTSILSPLRTTTASSLRLRDESALAFRSHSTIMAEYGLRKNIVAVDSRGRMITVEGKNLNFSVASPFTNVKILSTVCWEKSALNKSDMCITSKYPMDYQPLGIRINKTNERLLLVWGACNLHVLVLDKSCTGVVKAVSINLEMEHCMSESVVDAMWVRNPTSLAVSESCFVVCTTNSVKYYDISCEYNVNEIQELLPLIFFVMSYDDDVEDDGHRRFIKSMAILPPPRAGGGRADDQGQGVLGRFDEGR